MGNGEGESFVEDVHAKGWEEADRCVCSNCEDEDEAGDGEEVKIKENEPAGSRSWLLARASYCCRGDFWKVRLSKVEQG